MDSRSAPSRLRGMTSWLLNQTAASATQLVSTALATVDARRYHYSMLAALAEFGPMSQAELGRRCGLDRSDVAAAVAELETGGLVDRSTDTEDRRRNVVRITTAGARQLRSLDKLLGAVQKELLAPLSAAERQELARLLTKLADHHATG